MYVGGRLLKRIVCVTLIAVMLFCSFGCRKAAVYDDEAIFTLFADAIKGFDFASAYGYVCSAVRSESQSTDDTITEQDFIDKYTSIFNALGVVSVMFTETGSSVSGSYKEVNYTVVYDTDMAGVLSFDGVLNAVLDGSAWRVVWSPALIFPDMDWSDRVLVTSVAARRGDIIADGEIIAQTVDYASVYINTAETDDIALTITRLSDALLLSREDVQRVVDKAYNGIAIVKQYLPDDMPVSLQEIIKAIDGADISYGYGCGRTYPYGSFMAHTLGYVGSASEDEVLEYNSQRDPKDGLYTTDSIVGKSGLERTYESVLRGKDGYTVTIRNSVGELVSTLYKKPVEDGEDVHLTIDFELQQRAENALDLVLWGDNTAGAVIAMDPTTGAIKAIASYPTYDLNPFANGISSVDYQAILDQKNAPLYNRTIRGLYPPGSSFKVFTACAAMETGTLGTDYVFSGKIENDYWTPTDYGAWIWPAIKRATVYNRSTPLNMENAILHSDNIYFANAALLMGEDKFMTYMERIGMNSALPFELSVAQSQLKNDDTDMNYKLLADSGYGQGEVLISPLQLATMYCAFRNGGDMPVPYITGGYYRTIGVDYSPTQVFSETIWIENAIDSYSIAALTPMMQKVMSPTYNGTGRSLRVSGCTVAGKTGTAEIGSDKSREIAWFVGFRINVDTEDELLVLVVLEIPTDSRYTSLKFDIARELLSMNGD